MKKSKPYKLPKGKGLILRTCAADMTGHGGFKWPKSGLVKCPDWDPAPKCGNGLHGLWKGEGSGSLLSIDDNTRVWLVAEVEESQVVHINDGDSIKCKFPSAKIVFCGDSKGATDFIALHCKDAKAIVRGTSTSGVRGTSTSGDGGTSISGDRGTSTSGDSGTSTSGVRGTSTSGDSGTSTSGVRGTSISGVRGTSTSGDRGTSTSGDGGTSTSGYRGTSISGDGGTSTSGDRGTSTSGDSGTSTSGDSGTSTSGDSGTSTSGDRGTSTSGYSGTSTSGVRGTSISGDGGTSKTGEIGIVVCRWYDNKANRYRLAVGYVGEDGIEANTYYRADEHGKLVQVKS